MTAREGRRFALQVGAALLVLAAILWWRGRSTLAVVLAALAGALLLAGVVAPARLGPVHQAWMGLAHAISKVTTPIFMGIVYYVVMTPLGILRRTLGRNPMVHAENSSSFWHSRKGRSHRGDLNRQF